MILNKRKKIIFYSWLAFITCALSFYFFNPVFFEPQNLKNIFSDNLAWGLIIYFILWTLRGFTLIPSTPMIIAGMLVFPPVHLFLVNFACVFTSSAIVYFWWKYLWFDVYFSEKCPRELNKLKSALKKRELAFITLWSFFPFVPTDMICYVSEILKIKLWKCLTWVWIWEWIISAIYIFLWDSIIKSYF